MFVVHVFVFSALCLSLTATAYNWNDPCNLMPQGPRDKTSTVNVNVPASCHNGTFDWNYPQGTINLIFHNQNKLSMSVCLRDYLGGDVFTIHDITGGQFTPVEVLNGRLHGFANAKDCVELEIQCLEKDFRCMDGTQCVNKSFLCDGEPDCLDHSDELICADGPKTCTHPEEFQCHSGECIPRDWVSDAGPADCDDGSDEIDVVRYCEGGTDRFLCDNKEQCIPGSYLCDSVQQCVDGSDENACETACRSHNCSHMCKPTPSGGICSCPSGYSLTSDTVCKDNDECTENSTVCDQLCSNTDGSYHCGCQTGFQLQPDGHSCLKIGSNTEQMSSKTVKLIVAGTQGLFSVDVLYYNTSTMIGHRIIHMTGTSQLVLAREADAVVYDPVTDVIIFHDVMSRTIRSMPFKGEKNKITVKNLYPDIIQLEGLALDVLTRNLYWTTYLGFLFVGKLDGSMSTHLIKEGLDKPRGIAIDSKNSYLYLTHWGQNSGILRCFLDGTDCVTMVDLTGHPNFIDIEPVPLSHDGKRMLYWTDSRNDKIWGITESGVLGNIELTNARNPHPFGLVISRDIIFYTDLNTHLLHGIDRSNVSAIHDLDLDMGSLYDVILKDSDQTLPVRNSCYGNNGGCSHFCFPRPKGQPSCFCPATLQLRADNKTCEEITDESLKVTPETTEDSVLLELVKLEEELSLLPGVSRKDKKGPEKGASKLWIVGVVLGIAVLIGVVLLVVFLYLRKIRSAVNRSSVTRNEGFSHRRNGVSLSDDLPVVSPSETMPVRHGLRMKKDLPATTAVKVRKALHIAMTFVKRGKTFPLLQVFRYSKKSGEEFQELVPDDTSSKIPIQNKNRFDYLQRMTCYRPREVSMISVDSAFIDTRADANNNASMGSFTTYET